MTQDDRGRLATALMVLGETFNEPVSELRAEGYFEALRDMGIEAIEAAVRMALRTKTFFPKPAELRELVSGNREEMAELAWLELVSEVRRVGWCGTPQLSETTHAAMERVWGNWVHLCETLPGAGPELLGWAKRWKESYGATAGSLERGELIGRDEAKRLMARLTQQLPEADERDLPTLSARPSDSGDV